ncbi:PAS and ANTAR domain-containing protein [Nocardioides zeicaulis]|uniref:PAS and ANTAR domain-containing protein n=1 Tax=Nocardioides zeicaulis TaxID=1776857 RepID=A0ABV6E2K0_9ACTN
MGQRRAGDGFLASRAALVGRYRYRPDTDEWTWTDAVYRIHGFEPGEVVPTTELVMRHIHPADRPMAWESRESALEREEPFSFLHRIVTARNGERVVIAAGHVERADDGSPAVCGHLIDLTEVRHDAVAAEVDTAVADLAGHRAVIEQAKGVLVQLYSVDADTAFAVLRAFSMDANVKVREAAQRLVSAAAKDLTPTKGRAPSAHDLLERLQADACPDLGDRPAHEDSPQGLGSPGESEPPVGIEPTT